MGLVCDEEGMDMRVAIDGNVIDRDLLSYPVARCSGQDTGADHLYLFLQIEDGSKTDDLLNNYAFHDHIFSIEFEGVIHQVRCGNLSASHQPGHAYVLYRDDAKLNP